ncbi:MAG: YceD family protein [Gammaproteobacteria bacterium]
MSSGLPEFLDLARVTRQPLELAGRIRIGAMTRLRVALSGSDGEARVQLQAHAESGQIMVQGEAQAELVLTCQRCLRPMQQHVSAEFRLAWVRDEREAATLQTGSCDPLLSADGRVKLAELVEDELLLALPIVALHEMQECDAGPQDHALHTEEPELPARENPFAVLEQLKQRR